MLSNRAGETMRRLICIPIIHTQSDMGTIASSVKAEYIGKYGKAKYQEHLKTIDSMWQGIKEKLAKLKLDYSKARIYQDGLPVCGKEKEIVTSVASSGSQNHKIILDLMKQGAELEGTEDKELLLEEYAGIKNILQIKDKAEKERMLKGYNKDKKGLLAKRDRFIAERISQTLKEGETGILFIGLLHRVDKCLAKDIKIEYLIYRLPFKAGSEY